MNVEKIDLEIFNSFLEQIEKTQAAKEEIDPSAIVQKKSCSFLGLSNVDEDENYSDLTFDEKEITKASSDNSVEKTNNNSTNSTDNTNNAAKSSAASTLQTTLTNIEKEIASITTERETLAQETANLNASYQNAVAAGNSTDINKYNKQMWENAQKDELLKAKQNVVNCYYERLSEIDRVNNMTTVKALKDTDSRKVELQDILENEEKINAMEKGDKDTFASLEKKESSIQAKFKNYEVKRYSILADIKDQPLTSKETSQLSVKIEAEFKLESLVTKLNYLYYDSAKYSAEVAAAELNGDQTGKTVAQNKLYKNELVITEYEKIVINLDNAIEDADTSSSVDELKKAMNSAKVNDEELTKDDGDYSYNNGRLYKNGKKYTGEYCGKYYKKGRLYNGKVKDKSKKTESKDKNGQVKTKYAYTLYVNGEKYTGFKKKKHYTDGVLTNGEVDGVMYCNGKKCHGVATYTPNKADGTPDTENAVTKYYKKGVPATGKYQGKMYVNGVLFTGTYKKKTYVNGVRQK